MDVLLSPLSKIPTAYFPLHDSREPRDFLCSFLVSFVLSHSPGAGLLATALNANNSCAFASHRKMDFQRHLTPPTIFEFDDYNDFHGLGASASTAASYFTNEWSPESIMTVGTAATTPPKSPPKIREIGPALLPRVRPQDQQNNASSDQDSRSHIRTASLPVKKTKMQLQDHLRVRPSVERRSSSPPMTAGLVTPGSAPLPFEHMMLDPASARPSFGASRSKSTLNIHTHARHSSSTSIDASVLGRYGFPTYRQSPTPQPMSASSTCMSRTASAMSHLTPISMPGGQIQSYPARKRTASPPANPSRLSTELDFDPLLEYGESSILEYLTAPNPTPSLTQRTVESNRAQNAHCWFDVRNVAPWSDFATSTISTIPGLINLLQVRVTTRDLPAPGRVNLIPETSAQLADMCANYHAVKVNAALKLAQGDKHMAMRALKSTAGAKPEFISSYQSEIEQTIYGDGRGRVVGIVKCYDQCNSGMRNGSPGDKVKYLQSLAQLQRFMREHECRYGFIMTEIELVCVRAGGVPDVDSNVPLFGYIEVAEPVRAATHGTDENGNLQMTAGLALWYLHMLAKEQPFPGQYHWKMDVGTPAQLSRQKHLARDSWMPKPNLSETREAKRLRGWVWPNEGLSKRECGRGRRVRSGR